MAELPNVDVPALELRGIQKHFGATHANRGVTLRVARGSVHGLVGENGAGKSTLMNIAFGLVRPDVGEILVDGMAMRLNGAHEAIAQGLGMVHQHFMLVDEFTVLENVLLGREDGFALAGPLARARSELEALARDYGLSVPLDRRLGELPVGLRQRVEIIKALFRRARILILDEPTAVLTPQEADQLFALVRRLRDEGKSVILVTHKLREIMAVTDRVTVMRHGAVVLESATSAITIPALAEAMIGRPPSPPARGGKVTTGEVVLSVNENGISFELHAGEIVGLAGVSGNGQTELVEAIVRVARGGAGDAEKIGHIPEDRLRSGLVPEFSAGENGILGQQGRAEFNRGVLLDRKAIAAMCAARMEAYDVRPRLPELPVASFSGGNQQKLIIARELASEPTVVLANQPTRGVDVGAIEFIHAQLLKVRQRGAAVLLVSVELDEILALSDRTLVMSAGVIVGELSRAEATPERLGLLMAGVGRAVGQSGRPAVEP